jgi:DNA-binding response OmpR family regulator
MPRILIVDDEPDIARSLKLGLERRGFAVDTFCDPLEALANYNSGVYQLLIIDLRMPGLNGVELGNSIREKDPGALMWFLTAFELHSDEFKKMVPNIDSCVMVRKPISIKELARKMEIELIVKDGVSVSAKTNGLGISQ